MVLSGSYQTKTPEERRAGTVHVLSVDLAVKERRP